LNVPDYRRATPGYRVVATVDGRIVKLTADDLGVITIETDDERRLADRRNLPLTRVPKLSNDEVADLQRKTKKEAG
jgi:hypothetical protein